MRYLVDGHLGLKT
uniref:Uncharacterized protein n=1 Tax=Solanum lycopersicum TaxID=4081 RepID=A0A3Q7F3N0_SOLLC